MEETIDNLDAAAFSSAEYVRVLEEAGGVLRDVKKRDRDEA